MGQKTEKRRTATVGLLYLIVLIVWFRLQGRAMGSFWRNTVEIVQKNFVYYSGHGEVEKVVLKMALVGNHWRYDSPGA
jgi:hypothetical protein